MYYVQKVNLSVDAAKHTLKGLTILYKRAIIYTQIATLLSHSDVATSVWRWGVSELVALMLPAECLFFLLSTIALYHKFL